MLTSSNCVIWDGPDINCIGICKGDTVSDIVYKIAKQVCEVTEGLDVNSLTYECIIDRSRTYGKIDLFLFFSIILKNHCDLKTLIDEKIDSIDNTELLVDNLDLKCFLRDYLDSNCRIVRFFNSDFNITNPNAISTVFQYAEINDINAYYVSDIDQKIWRWDNITHQYLDITDVTDLNSICVCEIEELDLDIRKTLDLIIRNLCQTKSTGIIKACDPTFKPVVFNTVDPNEAAAIFIPNIPLDQNNYYISSVTHKVWRYVISELAYIPSVLGSNNINILDLGACVTSVELQLQAWIDLYNVYQEPLITSCLSSSPTLSSVHLETITDPAICTLNRIVGDEKSINYSAIGPCDNICKFGGAVNGLMFFQPGCAIGQVGVYYVNSNYPYPFIYNPISLLYEPYVSTLASVEKNQWNELCNLITKLKTIETECCSPDCDGIEIGFSSQYNSEEESFTLVFNGASGTNIPDDFEDCGSIITATDVNGTSISINAVIEQDAEIEISVSSLDISKPVSIGMKTCFSKEGIVCKKCSSFQLPAIDVCGFCKVCAIGDKSDYVELTYTLASDPNIALVHKLFGGQCLTFSLPEDKPTILTVIYSSDNIILDNDPEKPCDVDIPVPIPDTCWFFELPTTSSPGKIHIDNASCVPLSFIAGIDFYIKNEIGNTHSIRYGNLFTYTDPSGIALNGPVSDGIGTIGGTISWRNILPTSLPVDTSLLSAAICENGGFKGEWITFGTYPFPQALTSNGKAAVTASNVPLGMGVAGVVNRSIDYTRTKVNAGPVGIIFKIQNQPIDKIPELSLIDPISGSTMYSKGQLVDDDCQCPS